MKTREPIAGRVCHGHWRPARLMLRCLNVLVDGKEAHLTIETFDDRGLHFEYPSSWELEVTDHGQVITVAVQDPGGLGFALITTDESRPDPRGRRGARGDARGVPRPRRSPGDGDDQRTGRHGPRCRVLRHGHDQRGEHPLLSNLAPHRPGVWPMVRCGRGRPSQPDPRRIPDYRGYRAVADLSHRGFPAT